MAISSSYFQSNSLSGTATVTNGQVRVYLPTNFYALEGSKSFVIKLRRGSIFGIVACSTPTITIQDTSSLDSITANVASVNEGGIVKFDITTGGVANGYPVYYSVEPKAANLTINDFYNKSNTGVVYILNNQASITLQANTDSGVINEDGEAFALQLRSFSTTGPVVATSANVTIFDLFKTPYYTSGINANAYIENQSITFTASLGNYVGPGITKYYYTIGNVLSSEFVSGNTGTINFTANGGSNVLVLQLANNIPTDEERTVQFAISDYPSSTPNVVSSTAYIYDINVYSLQATGGAVETITDGANTYKMHTFTSSGTFTITKNINNTPIEYILVAGGGAGGGNNGPGPGAPYAYGGGGGAGGLLTGNTAGTVNTYTVTVGGGGSKLAAPAASGQGGNGTNSNIFASGFSPVIAIGGGGGGGGPIPSGGSYGQPGGSGGGNSYYVDAGQAPGITPSGLGTPGQGNPGGSPAPEGARGGGGAGTAGFKKLLPSGISWAGYGGNGIAISWVTPGYGTTGDPRYPGRWFAGGGGGDTTITSEGRGIGGYGGGADGGPRAYPLPAGGTNTGGGGGGGYGVPATSSGSAGGSGIVIIRYKYPYPF